MSAGNKKQAQAKAGEKRAAPVPVAFAEIGTKQIKATHRALEDFERNPKAGPHRGDAIALRLVSVFSDFMSPAAESKATKPYFHIWVSDVKGRLVYIGGTGSGPEDNASRMYQFFLRQGVKIGQLLFWKCPSFNVKEDATYNNFVSQSTLTYLPNDSSFPDAVIELVSPKHLMQMAANENVPAIFIRVVSSQMFQDEVIELEANIDESTLILVNVTATSTLQKSMWSALRVDDVMLMLNSLTALPITDAITGRKILKLNATARTCATKLKSDEPIGIKYASRDPDFEIPFRVEAKSAKEDIVLDASASVGGAPLIPVKKKSDAPAPKAAAPDLKPPAPDPVQPLITIAAAATAGAASVTPATDIPICGGCSAALKPENVFCSMCGFKVNECPSCKKALRAGAICDNADCTAADLEMDDARSSVPLFHCAKCVFDEKTTFEVPEGSLICPTCATSTSAMYCTDCRSVCDSDSRFCGSCGSSGLCELLQPA